MIEFQLRKKQLGCCPKDAARWKEKGNSGDLTTWTSLYELPPHENASGRREDVCRASSVSLGDRGPAVTLSDTYVHNKRGMPETYQILRHEYDIGASRVRPCGGSRSWCIPAMCCVSDVFNLFLQPCPQRFPELWILCAWKGCTFPGPRNEILESTTRQESQDNLMK
jgi:hypothetical protein